MFYSSLSVPTSISTKKSREIIMEYDFDASINYHSLFDRMYFRQHEAALVSKQSGDSQLK